VFQVQNYDRDRIVFHNRAQRRGLLRDLALGGQPRGDVHRRNQYRIMVAETDALRGDLNVENFPVLAAMLPHAQRGNGQGILAQDFQQARNVCGGTNVGNFHPQKFFARISVVFDCGVVYVEIVERVAIENEHGMGMAGKKQPKICVGVQRKWAKGIPCSRAGLARVANSCRRYAHRIVSIRQ